MSTAAVVVCAYTERRWVDLVEAVASAHRQDPAPAEVVLVVDHHPGLARRARAAVGGTTVLESTHRRGLSGARNTALDHLADRADVDVVAFLDDDAAARPGWLAALLAPYTDPAVVGVGGVAVPRWPASTGHEAPAVLPRELWWVVGCTYTGQVRGPGVSPVRNLMGCSMSFRRDAVTEAGGFREDLGRVGTVPLGCEETELCLRLAADTPGARLLLHPDAVVDHRVSADRTGWRYLARRSWAEGLSKAAISRSAGSGPSLASERAYTARVLPAAVRRELAAARPEAAAAVPTALAAAGAGYLRGRLARAQTAAVITTGEDVAS